MQHQNEKVIVNRLLMTVAKEVTDSISTFSTWLLAGYGAAFSLLVAQVDKKPATLPLASIRWAMGLFLLAFLLGVISRFLFAQVTSAAKAAEAVPELMKGVDQSAFSLDVFVSEYTRGQFPWLRWFVQRALKRTAQGDFAAGGRLVAKLSQVSVLLTLAQMLLGLGAATIVLAGI